MTPTPSIVIIDTDSQANQTLLAIRNTVELPVKVVRPRRSPKVSFMDENGEIFKLGADDLLEPFEE